MQNICITLGRLGVVSGPLAGKAFGDFAQVWCETMTCTRNDWEKTTAFVGLTKMVQANPQACMGCIPQLFVAICSCYPVPPPMAAGFVEILNNYKPYLGADWQTTYARLPQDVQWVAKTVYNLAP